VTRYAYDEAGRRILADDNTVPGVERTVYDAQGNVSQEWDEAPSGSQESATRSTYGPSGELLAQAAPGSKVATDVTTYDSAGQPIAERPTVGPATRYGYNAAGDLLLVESPTEAGANVTTMSVDLGGRTVLSSSSGQAPVRTTYDLAGETLSTRVGDLGPTREFRNSLGWSLRTVEPDGFETRRTYDQLGHAVAEQAVGGYSSAASFDACGRAVSRINADGTRLAIVYDVFGRPIRERHTSSAGQQLANIVTDYDRAGRALSESDTLAGWRRDRFYDSSGTVTTIESRRTGTVLTRTQVEASGVLRSAEATIAGVRVDLSTTATDTAGRVTDISSRSLPGDRRVTFDDAGRLLRTGLRSGSDATATGVATYEYSSIDGRKNAEAASFKLRGTESSSFRYSGAGRLSSVNTNGLTSTFAYTDATGALRQYRRGKEASVTILTDYLGRPTSAGSSAYGWDSLGRRISSYVVGDGWTTYGWTGDRLSTASSLLRMSASYLYDANGQRLRSAVTSGGVTTTTNWEYDGLRLLGYTAAASTGATWSVDFVYDPDGKPFGAVYRASDALPIAFSFRTTARGDVRELLDAGGNAFGHYSYDAYGVPVEVVSAPTSRVPASLATRVVARQPLRYAGYVWDPETRLYYLSERYYDPRIASFLSRDPLRTAEDGSSFQYCGGDPVGRTDPEGTMFLSLQDRTRYNRIRRKLVAAARQLVSLKIKYGNGQQRAAAGGRMDCSGAVGWILRQADPWFAKRIPSPASHERWNTDSFVAKLGWRTRYRGVGSFTAGRPWRIGDVVVKGWSGAKMGHIAIVVKEGKRPQVFECAASKREGYKPGARILPLSSVSYWRPVYVGRLFGYEPNAPYGGKR
jgi:RHS repeat-associated protein